MKDYREMAEHVFQRRDTYMVAQKKRRSRIKKAVITLNCFCLVALICLGVWKSGFWSSNPVPSASALSPTPSSLPGNMLIEMPEVAPPVFEFTLGVVVEAKVTKVFPDVYEHPQISQQYHVLELQVLDVITGKNVPQTLYFCMNSFLSTDLEQFDSMIFSLRQVGIENYLMINQTTGKAELFPSMFEHANPYGGPSYGSVLAFSDGQLEEGLWQLENWYAPENTLEHKLTEDENYPAKRNCTVEFVKENIKDMCAKADSFIAFQVFSMRDFSSAEMQEAFAYVEPFENGLFAQFGTFWNWPGFSEVPSAIVSYTRFIHGVRTNEIVEMRTNGELTYLGERFTDADLQQIPDLSDMMASLDLESLAPPHISDTQNLHQSSCSVGGKYVKINDVVYSIVRVNWCFQEPKNAYVRYYDYLYYLVETDGSYRTIEREELQALIGEDDVIVLGEYGVGVEQPYV